MSGGTLDKRAKTGQPAPLFAWAIDVLWAVGWVTAAAAAAAILSREDTPPVPMIFLAAVIFASVGRGARSGVLAAILAFSAYDYFWVPPVHVVQLRTPYEITTLVIFLGLALITALSSGNLRDRARRSAARQRRLLAFARAGGVVALPADAARSGDSIVRWVHEIVGSGVYYRDADGRESRAGDAKTWWDTVQTSLRGLASLAAEQPGRTHRSGDLRARAVCDSGHVFGALVWLSSEGPQETRREIDDFVAVLADLAGAALAPGRRVRASA